MSNAVDGDGDDAALAWLQAVLRAMSSYSDEEARVSREDWRQLRDGQLGDLIARAPYARALAGRVDANVESNYFHSYQSRFVTSAGLAPLFSLLAIHCSKAIDRHHKLVPGSKEEISQLAFKVPAGAHTPNDARRALAVVSAIRAELARELAFGTDAPPSVATHKAAPKRRRGRPLAGDRREDARLLQDWRAAKAQGMPSIEEFARSRNLDPKETRWAIDRARKAGKGTGESGQSSRNKSK